MPSRRGHNKARKRAVWCYTVRILCVLVYCVVHVLFTHSCVVCCVVLVLFTHSCVASCVFHLLFIHSLIAWRIAFLPRSCVRAVKEARGLPGLKSNGVTSDPYCKVVCANQIVRTKTVLDTTKPVWNETFSLYVLYLFWFFWFCSFHVYYYLGFFIDVCIRSLFLTLALPCIARC